MPDASGLPEFACDSSGRSSDDIAKVTFGECPSGAGLQILFKTYGIPLSPKLQRDNK